MNLDIIATTINAGENERVEFKAVEKQVSDSFWETVCSFLNTKGGTIFIGVDDDKKIVGVEQEYIEKIKTEIITLANNYNKLNPPFGLFPEEVKFGNKTIIQVNVPASSLVHKIRIRKDNVVFIRQHESDVKIAAPDKIAEIVNNKKAFYSESKIYPALQLSDFDDDIISYFKNLLRSKDPTSIYLQVNKLNFFKKTQLHRTDYTQAKRPNGFTLAAVLLFGKDEVIKSILPHFKIDAVVKRKNKERYDDRLLIENKNLNLFSVYNELTNFIKKHFDEGFYLENNIRISLRDRIFRELIVNFLIHQDYTNATVSQIVITRNEVRLTNPTNPNPNLQNPFLTDNVNSYPKNPIIQHIFGEISLFEGRGSGVPKVNRDLAKYIPGSKPIFVEEQIFKTIIPLKNIIFGNIVDELIKIGFRILPDNIHKVKKLSLNMSFNELENKNVKIFELLYAWKIQVNNFVKGSNRDIKKGKFKINKIPTILIKTEKVYIEILFNTISSISILRLMECFQFSNRSKFKKNYVNPLLFSDLIAYTIPNKPNSRNQKYKITESGRQVLGAYFAGC